MARIPFRRLVREVMDPVAARFGLPLKEGTAPDVVAYEVLPRGPGWRAIHIDRGRVEPNLLRVTVWRYGRFPVVVTPTYPWKEIGDYRWEFTDQASLLALLRHLAALLLQYYPQWLGWIPEPIASPPHTEPPLPERLPPEPVPEDWRWVIRREEAVLVPLLHWERDGEEPPPDAAYIAGEYMPPLPVQAVKATLAVLVQRGWVAPAGRGRYRLTPAGRAEAERRLADVDVDNPDLLGVE